MEQYYYTPSVWSVSAFQHGTILLYTISLICFSIPTWNNTIIHHQSDLFQHSNMEQYYYTSSVWSVLAFQHGPILLYTISLICFSIPTWNTTIIHHRSDLFQHSNMEQYYSTPSVWSVSAFQHGTILLNIISLICFSIPTWNNTIIHHQSDLFQHSNMEQYQCTPSVWYVSAFQHGTILLYTISLICFSIPTWNNTIIHHQSDLFQHSNMEQYYYTSSVWSVSAFQHGAILLYPIKLICFSIPTWNNTIIHHQSDLF